jgi:hypothetical protein
MHAVFIFKQVRRHKAVLPPEPGTKQSATSVAAGICHQRQTLPPDFPIDAGIFLSENGARHTPFRIK